jgi:oligopeptide transport system permease protein
MILWRRIDFLGFEGFMTRFLFRRFVWALPTLATVVIASFFLMHAAPGGPFDAEANLEPEVLANIRTAYDLDKPLLQQFWLYVSRAARGDFGPSLVYKDYGVTELIATGMPVSIQLGMMAMLVAVLIGTLAGIVASLRQNSWLDHAGMGLAMTGIALPSFVVAPLLVLFFALWLRLLPVAGWNGGDLAHMILPVIALALPQIAVIARLTRAGMLEVLGAGYIRAARARGLPESKVITGHVLSSALVPLIGYLGPALAGIVTGSVVVELIFNLPGLGRYFVQGALNRDYPLVMGIVILYAGFIVIFNLLADLIYAALDPRVRRGFR